MFAVVIVVVCLFFVVVVVVVDVSQKQAEEKKEVERVRMESVIGNILKCVTQKQSRPSSERTEVGVMHPH